MRKIIFMSLLFSMTASAAVNPAEVKATFFAYQLSRLKSAQDLQMFVQGKANKALLERDLKNFKNSFKPPTIRMPSANLVVVSSGEISIAIEFLKEAAIEVNKKKIVFRKNKTYINYKSEIESAVRWKSAGHWIWPSAHAGGPFDWLFGTVAAVMPIDYLPYNLKPGAGVDRLIGAYRYEQKVWKEHTDKKAGKTMFSTLTFTCKGTQLDKAFDETLIFDGQRTNSIDNTLTRKEDGSLTYQGVYSCPAGAQMSSEGEATQDYPGCIKKGANIYEMAPFFQFPKVAADCCATNGCYEKVKAEVDSIVQEMLSGSESSGSSAPVSQ